MYDYKNLFYEDYKKVFVDKLEPEILIDNIRYKFTSDEDMLYIIKNLFLIKDLKLFLQYIISGELKKSNNLYLQYNDLLEQKSLYLSLKRILIRAAISEIQSHISENNSSDLVKQFILRSVEFIIKDFFNYGLFHRIMEDNNLYCLRIRNGLSGQLIVFDLSKNMKFLSNEEIKEGLFNLFREELVLENSSKFVPVLNYRVDILKIESQVIINIQKQMLWNKEEYLKMGLATNDILEKIQQHIDARDRNILIIGNDGKFSMMNLILKMLVGKEYLILEKISEFKNFGSIEISEKNADAIFNFVRNSKIELLMFNNLDISMLEAVYNLDLITVSSIYSNKVDEDIRDLSDKYRSKKLLFIATDIGSIKIVDGDQ